MDIRFGTWNVRSWYRASSLQTVSKELPKYKLDLVGVQEVRWEGVPLNEQENTHFSMEKGMIVFIAKYN
jgi:exonuclease III